MQTKNNIARKLSELSHSPANWGDLFICSQFDHVSRRGLVTARDYGFTLGKYPEEMTKAFMVGRFHQVRLQVDLSEFFEGSQQWRKVVGFQEDATVQSTYSRFCNNSNLHRPLGDAFIRLGKLVGHKKIHYDVDLEPELLSVINAGYFPLAMDATHIPLSKG